MKREEISQSIGNISLRFVEEAAMFCHTEKGQRSRNTLVKWLSLAACFCLIVTGAFAGIRFGLINDDKSESSGNDGAADFEDAPCPEEIYSQYSISNGALCLEIFDSYTVPEEADVITVLLTGCKGNGSVFFRSSQRNGVQTIRRIESTDKLRAAEERDGVFTFSLDGAVDFVYLNIYFDPDTFRDSAQRSANGDECDKTVTDDEIHSTDQRDCAEVYFECSAISADGAYDEICFKRPLALISSEPKINISGTADTLNEAADAVGLSVIAYFEGYIPENIVYSKTTGDTQVEYHYGINSDITVRIYESDKNDHTLDTFVNSLNWFDLDLYPFNTRTEHKSGCQYDIYTCYKNGEGYKSEITVLNYTAHGYNIFIVILFDLYGDDAEYEIKQLMDKLCIVDLNSADEVN